MRNHPLSRCVLWTCLGLAILLMGFGGVRLKLKDLKTVPCPDEPQYSNLLTSGSATTRANCFFIEGTVVNTSGSDVYNADVFGRIYDANGNDVLPERTRLGAIDEVTEGESPFQIRISVPETNPLPLSLEQFKASGFRGKVRR